MAYLRRSPPLIFHTASTLSGSLRSPPSPRGEGCVSGIALSPSNLRPFGAPPSMGRRVCPPEPLPLEGARGAARRGWLPFFAAEPPPLRLPHRGRGTASAVDRVLSLMAHLRRPPPLSFIPLLPNPPLRGTFPLGEGCDTEIPLSSHLLLDRERKKISRFRSK